MSDKSYVTMEQHVCSVCGKPFDTGAILLDQRLRNTFERNTVTGYGLCPEHQAKFDEGYVALVECDVSKSGNPGATCKPEDAYRTGNVAFVRRVQWVDIFNVPIKDDLPMVFVEQGVIDRLKAMQEGEQA